MATLLALRTALNGEVGVADADTVPWTAAVRTQAIRDGYADLWRMGVWKTVSQDIATVTDQWRYTMTGGVSAIRRIDRLELLDSSSRVVENPRGWVEEDGTGGWVMHLDGGPLSTGATLRVRGWTAYKSQFTGDSDTDDIPVEHQRIPLLKAKAILYRIALGVFARTGEAQALPAPMNASGELLLATVAAAEREYTESAERLSGLRRRTSYTRRR